MEFSGSVETSGHGNGPTRTVAASYNVYEHAERAVDRLSDEGFAVERVSIVANDLCFVEQVTGRVSYGRAALQGAASGAVAGTLFGFVFGVLRLVDPLVSGLTLALFGLVFGAVVGAVIVLIGHAASGRDRDFSSAGGMRADRYDVMVDEPVAEDAARVLASASLLEEAR